MEKPSFREYQAAKRAVKAWEREYRLQNNVRPDRRALSAASSEVQAAYSLYYKLSKAFSSRDPDSSAQDIDTRNPSSANNDASFTIENSSTNAVVACTKAFNANSPLTRQDTLPVDNNGSLSCNRYGSISEQDPCCLSTATAVTGSRSGQSSLTHPIKKLGHNSHGLASIPATKAIDGKDKSSNGNLPASDENSRKSSTPCSSNGTKSPDQDVDQTDSGGELTTKPEVFGKFLNKPKEVPAKIVNRAPLSDLYSKLAQNMRDSILSSPSMPYAKLSLKRKPSKTKKLENDLKINYDEGSGVGKIESLNDSNVSSVRKSVKDVLKKPISQENETGVSSTENCTLSTLSQKSDNDADNSGHLFEPNAFKITAAPKRNTAFAVCLLPGAAVSSSRLNGKINSAWVNRCVGSTNEEENVIYDFSEDITQVSVSDHFSTSSTPDNNKNETQSASGERSASLSRFSASDSQHRSFSPYETNKCHEVMNKNDGKIDDQPAQLSVNHASELDVEVDGLTSSSSRAIHEPNELSDASSPFEFLPEASTNTSEELPSIPARGLKRKAADSLEELEESGKIVSVWPAPKKKRRSRIIKNSVEEITRHKLTIKAQRLKVESVGGKCSSPTTVRGRRRKKDNTGESPRIISDSGTNSERLVTSSVVTERVCDEVIDVPNDASAAGDGVVPEYDELIELEKTNTSVRRKFLKKEDKLTDKVKRGTLNENFVRIDLKKKTYARGKKNMTGGKFRRMEWKRKQGLKSSNGSASSGERKAKNLTCYKCGDFGHWAARCPGKSTKSDYTDVYERGNVDFLTLQQAEEMARGIKTSQASTTTKLFSLPSSSVSQAFSDSKQCSDKSISLLEKDTNSKPRTEKSINDTGCEDNNLDEENIELDGSDDEDATILDSKDDPYEELDDSLNADDMDDLEAMALSQDASQSTSSVGNLSQNEKCFKAHHRKIAEPVLSSSVSECPREVRDTLLMFGHSSFRPGQETAILRILQGRSTLLVLSTGSGKSLCYQLPAYLYAQKQTCITLCVSPLVSLMEDQVTGLPSFLRAVCLHTNQTPQQRTKALEAVRSGQAHILLVSPEAVVSSGAGGVLGTLMKDLPPIAFACVDEAHCVSQWSHNFRPSYLRVCSVLRDLLGVRTILGLTATARYETTLSIAQHLQVEDIDEGVIRGSSVPPNLLLSVSRDANRNEALVQLLHGDRFSTCESIIVYCTRRDECERVATLLRSQLLTADRIDVKANLKRNRGVSLDAEAYHAGLSASRRRNIQNKFMSGKLRIVVATVAFGMGIDKSDVRAIIHYNMPKNLESYVQEIGRAGRDGLPSQCHLFLDSSDGRDVQELKRFIFVNSVDRITVRKLLDKLFVPCICTKFQNLEPIESSSQRNDMSCPKHEVALPVAELVEFLDLPEENILTLFCYLELREDNLIQLLPSVYSSCTVICYSGAAQLCSASKLCPPLAVAIAKDNQRGISHQTSNTISFPVVQIASEMGWNSGIVKRELKALEWTSSAGSVRPSGVKVEFSDLAFHLMVRGNLTDDDRDRILDELHARATQQETDQLKQLQYTHQTLRAASHASILLCCDQVDDKRCSNLKDAIGRYFAPSSSELEKVVLEKEPELTTSVEGTVRQEVRSLLSTHTDHTWTARAVARVLHGIQSPNFPASVWGRVRRIWRSQINVPFKHILTIAQQEIIKWRRL